MIRNTFIGIAVATGFAAAASQVFAQSPLSTRPEDAATAKVEKLTKIIGAVLETESRLQTEALGCLEKDPGSTRCDNQATKAFKDAQAYLKTYMLQCIAGENLERLLGTETSPAMDLCNDSLPGFQRLVGTMGERAKESALLRAMRSLPKVAI